MTKASSLYLKTFFRRLFPLDYLAALPELVLLHLDACLLSSSKGVLFLETNPYSTKMTIPGIPNSMLACQIVEYNNRHQIHQVPTPQTLEPHDILLKVAVSSLCHTDLEYLAGNLYNKLPVTASHEGTGVVVALGTSVTDFKLGDRVLAGQTYHCCGECDICRGPAQFRHYCTFRGSAMSVERDGAFQEYLVTDARQATIIPDEVSFLTAAPLACAGVTVWHAILQADLTAGRWIGVVGSGGGLGHLAIQFAKARGLKVVGVDASDGGIELSKEAGANIVLDARKGTEHVVKEAFAATGGKGVDASLTVSDAKQAPATACAITRMHGTMVQVALVRHFAMLDIPAVANYLCSGDSLKKSLFPSVNTSFATSV